jgi:hypothetical protein
VIVVHVIDDDPRFPRGIDMDPVGLVAERTDVSLIRRRRAALPVLAIGRGYTPEDLVDGYPPDVLDAFGDELELAEALAHVDALLEILVPRMEEAA